MGKKEIFQTYFEELTSDVLYSEDIESYFYQYKKFILKIVIPNSFPKSLPEFYLSNYSDFNKWYSHVGSEGKLCYISENNLIWDIKNPNGLLMDCCEKVKELLDGWDTPKMTEELREEFLSYWFLTCSQSKMNPTLIQSYISKVSTFEKHELVRLKNKLYLFNQGSQLRGRIAPNAEEISDVYVLPLKDFNSVVPPNPQNELTEATFKRMITGNLSSGVRHRFQKWCKTKRKTFMLILSLPISDYDYILFGARFEYTTSKLPFKISNEVQQKNKNKKNVVSKKKKYKVRDCKITPVYITRYDKEYRVSRTSQEYDLMNKKTVIIGLGSVGSFVANNLSKMGIAKLLLIDPDSLTVDNISRHYLGMDSLRGNNQKVDALEGRLLKENPDLDIECEGIRFQEIVQKNPNLFDEYDFIFSCVGDTKTNFEINHFFRKSGKPVLYSWLDPYGIGYHNLLISPKYDGCYMCMNYADGRLVNNRASFAEENQIFEKRLASCSSAFIPYNVTAPSSLANKAIEIYLQFMSGAFSTGNRLISMLGSGMRFEEEGFVYSDRYYSCLKDCQYLNITLEKNLSCPECNGEY